MLVSLLRNVIRVGRLTVRMPSGETLEVGNAGEDTTPHVQVRLRGRLTPLKLAVNPDLYLGEAYMNGELELERGTLWDLMDLVGRNLNNRLSWEAGWLGPLLRGVRGALARVITPLAARRNVAHHYDLSEDLYREFLDEDLQYSCAYFSHPGLTLDDAQAAKKRHIIAKLNLRPGDRVLDIGCGWGGLALSIAKAEDVTVTGITLSTEQLKVCQTRARDAGLEHRLRFELCDYRELTGQYERIVSVGMFEHVGAASYDAFFRTLAGRLTDDGVALLHSIGQRGRPPGASNAWITKYIFPGGYTPAVSEVTGAAERVGLWLTDVEILRLHYAQTLRRWRQRFLTRSSQICALYDQRFVRMWEFYLAACEMSFRYGDLMVVQAQFAKHVDTLPLTRDYMLDYERELESRADARPRLVSVH